MTRVSFFRITTALLMAPRSSTLGPAACAASLCISLQRTNLTQPQLCFAVAEPEGWPLQRSSLSVKRTCKRCGMHVVCMSMHFFMVWRVTRARRLALQAHAQPGARLGDAVRHGIHERADVQHHGQRGHAVDPEVHAQEVAAAHHGRQHRLCQEHHLW